MNCKYRCNGVCNMDQGQVKDVFDNLCNKNVFTKKNGFYKYNF